MSILKKISPAFWSLITVILSFSMKELSVFSWAKVMRSFSVKKTQPCSLRPSRPIDSVAFSTIPTLGTIFFPFLPFPDKRVCSIQISPTPITQTAFFPPAIPESSCPCIFFEVKSWKANSKPDLHKSVNSSSKKGLSSNVANEKFKQAINLGLFDSMMSLDGNNNFWIG